MTHKVCQSLVHVWQGMKMCHKRRPKKKKKEQKSWLMSGCVCHVSLCRGIEGEGCTVCAFIIHILGSLTGIVVTVAAVHHQAHCHLKNLLLL